MLPVIEFKKSSVAFTTFSIAEAAASSVFAKASLLATAPFATFVHTADNTLLSLGKSSIPNAFTIPTPETKNDNTKDIALPIILSDDFFAPIQKSYFIPII
jgi:hypothetical protein